MAAENGAPKTLTLRSNDGEEFSVPESAAVLSVTIRNMVDDGCAEGVIPLANIDSVALSQIITYLNQHAAAGTNDEDEKKKKKFDEEFLGGKKFDELLKLVLAANYLNIGGLQEIVTEKLADLMKCRSVEWVRKKYGIVNDYTPEEEEEQMQENLWAFEDIQPDEDD